MYIKNRIQPFHNYSFSSSFHFHSILLSNEFLKTLYRPAMRMMILLPQGCVLVCSLFMSGLNYSLMENIPLDRKNRLQCSWFLYAKTCRNKQMNAHALLMSTGTRFTSDRHLTHTQAHSLASALTGQTLGTKGTDCPRAT